MAKLPSIALIFGCLLLCIPYTDGTQTYRKGSREDSADKLRAFVYGVTGRIPIVATAPLRRHQGVKGFDGDTQAGSFHTQRKARHRRHDVEPDEVTDSSLNGDLNTAFEDDSSIVTDDSAVSKKK
jgi:hypothetical protein